MIVAAFATVWSVPHASAGPGECDPAITPDTIDSCYFDWLGESGFDPGIDTIQCEDDPSEPRTSIFLGRITLDLHSFFQVRTQDSLGSSGQFVFLGASTDMQIPPFTRTEVCSSSTENISVPTRHICRAAILRSAPWRQLCQTQVHSGN